MIVCVFVFFRKDFFKVMCGIYFGRLIKIRIGYDNSGFGFGWFLNKVGLSLLLLCLILILVSCLRYVLYIILKEFFLEKVNI